MEREGENLQLSFKVKNEGVDENLIPDEDKNMLYTTFYDILNDLMAKSNLDVYVTGSNSKMLSKDIVTNFRDRGTEIKVYPLSFKEYYAVSGLEKADALEEYLTYGGMPLAVTEKDEAEKRKYLAKLNFRQQEKSHLMENMIYLELIRRGYSVDVGVVEVTRVNEQGKKQQSQYEIDFIVNTDKEKIYIQSALNVDTKEKRSQICITDIA